MTKTILKVVLACLLVLISEQGGAMSKAEVPPVSGPGMVLDPNELKDLERKADGGDVAAIQCLFDYYAFEDTKKASIWARKGARLGDAKLQYLLGGMIADSDDPKEREEGIRAMKKSAKKNYFLAQTSLARWYEEGRGIRKDLLLAEKWFSRAANQGDRTAMLEVVRLMTARATDVSTLSVAYGWTLLALKRTTSKWSAPFVDKIHAAQRDILDKSKRLGADEKEFISRAESWAKKQDAIVPMTDPSSLKEPKCKYWK